MRATVRGTVQGVGFRWFVRSEARTLRLAGYVRNLADGTVEIVAQGDTGAIDHLLGAVRAGPPGAIVREITVAECASEGELETPFDIRR